MDEADIANDKADQFVADALARAARAKAEAPPSSGTCCSCQDSIEPERIKANPHARLCQECAAEEEAERKRVKRIGA